MTIRIWHAVVLAAAVAAIMPRALAADGTPAPDTVPVPVPAPEADTGFYAFLRDFKSEALDAGIMSATYDRATGGISLNARVEELNELQPEFVRPVWEYLAGAVSDVRVMRGRAQLVSNADLFTRLEDRFGVPKEILTAIWGLETNFGQNTGGFNLFESLATLSYEGPRITYGRRQFIAALRIADREGLDPVAMKGSWAGAFGQTQFIPTTFLDHAVDGDGDGVRNVWDSPADALASAANYLKDSGWRPGESWGEEVRLPEGFAYENAEIDIKKPVSEWAALGVRKISGEALGAEDAPAAIFLPAGYRGPAFLLRNNFQVILRYNNATAYALAIGLLSGRLNGGSLVQAEWPLDSVPLDRSSRTALQEGLTALGFDTGASDGVLGRRTRQAVRDYQKARGLTPDGFPTPGLVTRILNERSLQQPTP